MIAGPDTAGGHVAYVIIVEFRAKPDQVAAFAELIDRHAHNSRRSRTAAWRSTSARIRTIPPASCFTKPTAIRRRTDGTPRWTATMVPGDRAGSVVPGSDSALPHYRQVLTRRPYL